MTVRMRPGFTLHRFATPWDLISNSHQLSKDISRFAVLKLLRTHGPLLHPSMRKCASLASEVYLHGKSLSELPFSPGFPGRLLLWYVNDFRFQLLVLAPTPPSTAIKHIVVIFGENVSFDHYFATYPVAANLCWGASVHSGRGNYDSYRFERRVVNCKSQ